MTSLITVSINTHRDCIRVQVNEPCFLERSTNNRTWTEVRRWSLDFEGGRSVFNDYDAPPNKRRYYRASAGAGQETVSAVRAVETACPTCHGLPPAGFTCNDCGATGVRAEAS